MKRTIVALVALVGVGHFASSVSLAASTRFVMVVSVDDGFSWHPSVVVQPGTLVRARMRVEFSGPETVTGLAGFNSQFTVTGWSSGDTLEPWGSPVVSVGGAAGGILPSSNGNGRLSPFGASATATQPTTSVSADVLTIAGSVAGRIPIGQGPSSLAGSFYNSSLSPFVFQFSFVVGSEFVPTRVVSATNIFNTSANNARWYTGAGSTSIHAPGIENVPAYVYIPAPGMSAMAALASLALARRRR